VLPVALVGLVFLLVSALPTLVARKRLDRAARALSREIRDTEQRIGRAEKEAEALTSDSFVQKRAMDELFSPGRSGPRPRRP
jgi:hypothetical protein